MCSWKKAGRQTESKTLENSIVARIVRKIKSLIRDRPSRRGGRMDLDPRKKSSRDRMIHSKSFVTQKVKCISRKEAVECRGFPSYEWE